MTARLVVLLALLLLASPAAAALKTYTLEGDQSTLFPACGTVLRPGRVSGTAVIDEIGDGSPTLVELELRVAWTDSLPDLPDFGCGIPGTTLFVDFDRTLRPAPSQTGTGSTTTSISWGALSGWTQTGRVVCETKCPGGCPGGCDECLLALGFTGTGPPPPLASASLDSDPWSFSADGFSFDASSIEHLSLGLGAVTGNIVWRGSLSVPIPALPLVGIAALGAGLLYLGARALRR